MSTKHNLDVLSQRLGVLKRRAKEASEHAANMQGLPNEISHAEGFAAGLDEAYFTMVNGYEGEEPTVMDDGLPDQPHAIFVGALYGLLSQAGIKVNLMQREVDGESVGYTAILEIFVPNDEYPIRVRVL